MSLRLTVATNPLDPICIQLVEALSADIGGRYGTDGKGAFDLRDVMVPRAAFVVAWLDDEPVGCGALRPTDDENTAEVKRMFVRMEARGNGISRQILGKLEGLAQNFGYKRVILETGTLNVEALGLYKGCGYQYMDCYGIYVGNEDSHCFEKYLSKADS